MRFAVAPAIARACRSYLGGELAPRLHPMLNRFYPDDRSGPSTMAVRIEKVRVRFFQVLLRAGAGPGQRPLALRAGKQQNVRKMFSDIWQDSLGFRGPGLSRAKAIRHWL